MVAMKNRLIIAALLTAGIGVSCEREEIYTPVEFRASLASTNTYRVGEPVQFDFTGNADFITVWNGDTGHEYRYQDREQAPAELFRKGELELKIYQQYGLRALDIYLTDRFEGLKGRNIDKTDPDINRFAEQDRKAIRQIIDSDFAGWDKFPFTDNTAARFESFKADISQYADNFCFAIRLRSTEKPGETMRTYMINPRITTEFERYGTHVRKFSQLSFVPFRMQGLWSDRTPYVHSSEADLSSFLKVNQNGVVKFRAQANAMAGADIAFQGFKIGAPVSASLPGVDYQPVDQWIFMQPLPLTSIPPDTGENIKGYADDVSSYTHVYNEPGTYTVTFIAATGNYQGESRVVREMNVTIIEPIGE